MFLEAMDERRAGRCENRRWWRHLAATASINSRSVLSCCTKEAQRTNPFRWCERWGSADWRKSGKKGGVVRVRAWEMSCFGVIVRWVAE